MTEGTKETPAALDGFERAKPDEPIFTLQGGDIFAIKAVEFYISERRQAAVLLDDKKKQEAEFLRCTEADKQLWRMQEYFQGYSSKEDEEKPIEAELIELHDLRVWAAGRISNAFSELSDIWEKLNKLNYEDKNALEHILCCISDLRSLYRKIEPRRNMK